MVLWWNVPFGFQVNEIYHEESLGVHINVVLVRMIMLGYAKVSAQFYVTHLFLESVWKRGCSQWEREKQEIRFNSLWCFVSCIIWRSNWKCLWNSRMNWNKKENSVFQPLRVPIMCTAICCLCTGEGSDPGTTPQWREGTEISHFCFSVITAATETRIPQSHSSQHSTLFWKFSRLLIIQWQSHNGNNAPHLVIIISVI